MDIEKKRAELLAQQEEINRKLKEAQEAIEAAKTPEQRVLENLNKTFKMVLAKAKDSQYADALKITKQMEKELKEAMMLESAH